MMDGDEVRARSDGKDRVAAATVWSVDVGGLRVRCLRVEGGYVAQARTPRGGPPRSGGIRVRSSSSGA